MRRLSPGEMVDGYCITGELGRGGMGVVYRARQVRLRRDVAIKVLHATLTEDPVLHARLLREARSVASLRHPAILVIHDVGEFEGTPYLVTEFIEGGTVAQFSGTPQSPATVLRLLGPVASALDYAHARGVMHRDIKSANILLRADGSPVLADFGLALAAGVDARLTRTGLMIGTPEYMAPEQAQQTDEALTPKADQYALAVIAYELLTGRVPFTAPSPLAVIMAHIREAPPAPRTLNPAITPGVEAALLRGLAKDPNDRFPSATAFIDALAGGEQVDALPRSRPDMAPTLAISTTPAPVAAAVPVASRAGAGSVPRPYIPKAAGMPARTRLIPALALLAALAAAGTVFALQANGGHGGSGAGATATATPYLGVLGQVTTRDPSPTTMATNTIARHTSTRTRASGTTATHVSAVRAPIRATAPSTSTDTATPVPSTSTGTATAMPATSTNIPSATATPTRQPSTSTTLPSATNTPPAKAATAVPSGAAGPPWVAGLAPGHITTVAGNGVRRVDSNGLTVGTYSGDGGPASRAGLSRPFSVAVDQAGNLIIADTFNNRIRRVSIATGTITNIADNGDYHYSGDGGPATAAGISPNSVAVDQAGNLYIADAANNRIRKVSAATGIITTIAGIGVFGDSGDGGPATRAAIGFPNYVTVDAAGNVYFADFGTERVRKVDQATGIITTVAGNGARGRDSAGNIVGTYGGDGGPAIAASLNYPTCVVVDGAGNVYIADRDNYRVRKVDAATGTISTVAGTGRGGFSGDGGPATSATLGQPSGLALDAQGNLYIADTDNNRVRMVAAGTGTISTIAGSGAAGSAGNNGDRGAATAAAMNYPLGLALDRMGNLYIADTYNNRVRVVRGVAAPR